MFTKPRCRRMLLSMSRVIGYRRRPEAVLVLVAAGAALLALASATGTSAIDPEQGWIARAGGRSEEQPPPQPPQDIEASSEIGLIAGVGLGVLMLVILALFVFSVVVTIAGLQFQVRRRDRAGGSDSAPITVERAPPQAEAAAMRRAARQALDELRRWGGDEPADAVVAAWLALERAAAEVGSVRAAHQTSAEFASTVLTSHDVDTAALETLRELYVRARFATGTRVNAADVGAAVTALETLVEDLSGSRS